MRLVEVLRLGVEEPAAGDTSRPAFVDALRHGADLLVRCIGPHAPAPWVATWTLLEMQVWAGASARYLTELEVLRGQAATPEGRSDLYARIDGGRHKIEGALRAFSDTFVEEVRTRGPVADRSAAAEPGPSSLLL